MFKLLFRVHLLLVYGVLVQTYLCLILLQIRVKLDQSCIIDLRFFIVFYVFVHGHDLVEAVLQLISLQFHLMMLMEQYRSNYV